MNECNCGTSPPDEGHWSSCPAKETVLEEAQRLIFGARQGVYGHPFDDFSRTARIWEAIFGVPVTPEQVALALIGVKISRLVESPDHHDSVVDIAGYAGCLARIQERRDGSVPTPE